jgi:hypothetical protein
MEGGAKVMNLRLNLTIALIASALGTGAFGDEPNVQPAGGDKSLGLQVQLGGTLQLSGERKADSFHRIIFKGEMLSSKGEKAKHTDPSHQFFNSGDAEKSDHDTDTNDLFLDFVRGSGSIKNDLLNGYGIDKIPLPRLLGPKFRSILRGGANLDGSRASLAFGYETEASHPIPNRLADSNWLVPGVNAEQRWTKGSKPTTVGTLTYRLFFGSSTWEKNALPAPFLFEEVLKLAPTVNDLLKFNDEKPATDNRDLREFLIDQAGSDAYREGMENYRAVIKSAYDDSALAYRLGLANALWVESDGWWDFVGEDHPRAKTFFAVVWSVLNNVSSRGVTNLQVRYETGFDRNDPNRINRVIGTLGFVF